MVQQVIERDMLASGLLMTGVPIAVCLFHRYVLRDDVLVEAAQLDRFRLDVGPVANH